MDIFIKSFNRPYYLERCIRSVYEFVKGDFRIKVLDDGTAPEYLQKIRVLFPGVEVILSPYYEEKLRALDDHHSGKGKYKSLAIPSQFWFEHISAASDIFLLLEDDIWLTDPIDLHHVERVMHKEHFVFLRLFWQGNKKLVNGQKKQVSTSIETIEPDIPISNRLLLYNRYYLASLLHRSKIIRKEIHFQLPFYTLYAVAAAFFRKDYWTYLWDGAQEKVNEPYQLKKADWWFRNKDGQYGKFVQEVAKTSYISSATGWLDGVDFDMADYNYILNKAWLSGKLDPMQNFPKDFSDSYIKQFLEDAGNPKSSYAEWQKWIRVFKGNYESLGCITE